MLRTRVKICGVTRIQDVQAACQAGADAIGLVFYPKSSRLVSLEQARRLRESVPAFVSVAALFVNAEPNQVQQVLEEVNPDFLQFHGDESPEYCAGFGRRYLKAFRVGGAGLDNPDAVLDACRRFPQAAAWLFDSYSAGYGGSGLTFDISLLSRVQQSDDSRPLVLAGGLDPTNVGDIVKSVQPYALDVSSGVEDSGGIKSADKMRTFMESVYRASWA